MNWLTRRKQQTPRSKLDHKISTLVPLESGETDETLGQILERLMVSHGGKPFNALSQRDQVKFGAICDEWVKDYEDYDPRREKLNWRDI